MKTQFLLLAFICIPFVSFLQKTGTLILSGDADHYGYDPREFTVSCKEEVIGHFDSHGHFNYSREQEGPLKINHPDFDIFTVNNLTVSKNVRSHNVFEKISPEAKERLLRSFKTEQAATCTKTDKRSLSTFSDTVAQFPGGYDALEKYIAGHFHYPQRAVERGIEGKVYVSFIVEADGSITCIDIFRGVDYILDHEAFLFVKNFPRFEPAILDGKAVPSVFTFPVSFSLN